MYVCVYACMYSHMHACMYVCKYVCMYVCRYVLCSYVCMHVCKYVGVLAYRKSLWRILMARTDATLNLSTLLESCMTVCKYKLVAIPKSLNLQRSRSDGGASLP